MSQYPKWKYHASHGSKLVQNNQQEAALGHGWTDSPATVNDPTQHSPHHKPHQAAPVSDGKAHPPKEKTPDELAQEQGYESDAEMQESKRLEQEAAQTESPSMEDPEHDEEESEDDREEESDADDDSGDDGEEDAEGSDESAPSDESPESDSGNPEPLEEEESAEEPAKEEKPKRGLFSRSGKSKKKTKKSGR